MNVRHVCALRTHGNPRTSVLVLLQVRVILFGSLQVFFPGKQLIVSWGYATEHEVAVGIPRSGPIHRWHSPMLERNQIDERRRRGLLRGGVDGSFHAAELAGGHPDSPAPIGTADTLL